MQNTKSSSASGIELLSVLVVGNQYRCHFTNRYTNRQFNDITFYGLGLLIYRDDYDSTVKFIYLHHAPKFKHRNKQLWNG